MSLSLKVVSDINKIYLYFVLSVYKLYSVNDCKWCLSCIVNCSSVTQLNVSSKESHEAQTSLRDPSILDRPFSTLLTGANILDCVPRAGNRNIKI